MIILRPDQTALKSAIYNEWGAGHSNVLAIAPTGMGKTVLSTDIILDGHNVGMTEVVMAHRNELVGQMSIAVARRGIKHRIIGSTSTISGIIQDHRAEFGRSFVNPDAKCSVGSVQTIVSRMDQLKQWAAQVDRWTLDECFPAGTTISTPSGPVPIESVRAGDIVTAWDEKTEAFQPRRVNRLFRNPEPETMVRVCSNGHHVVATINHPFWTARGWVSAGDLRTDDDLLVDVSAVQNSVHHGEGLRQLPSKKARVGLLQRKVRVRPSGQGAFRGAETTAGQSTKAVEATESCQGEGGGGAKGVSRMWHAAQPPEQCKNVLESLSGRKVIRNDGSHESCPCFTTNDRSKPNEACGCASQGFGLVTCDESQTVCAGWERQNNTESGAGVDADAGAVRVRSSICNCDQNESRSRLSDMLQTGCSTPDDENINRGRWKLPQRSSETCPRCEKRHVFAMQRVESVTVLQRSDFERSGDGHVYNFEVDELHTYVANGIVVHNCHHASGNGQNDPNMWTKAIRMFTNARGLGVTACPQRADGKGLGRHADGPFDAMVVGPTMRYLIDNRALSDYQIVVPASDYAIDDDAITDGGDYSPKKMRDASKRSHIVGDCVEEYQKHALGRRAICFATDVETANDIAGRFNEGGIAAASVSTKTDTGVRRDMIRRFRDGRLLVLVNVDLFDEGFDVPACDVVIMARPTASLNKYLQMCGRPMRINPANSSKVALIIDHVSNFKRHNLPDRPRAWTLDRRDKRAKRAPDPDDIPLTACRECSRPYERVLPRCPYCGAEPPLPAPGSRTPERVDGDLMLLDQAALAQMRAAMELEAPGDMNARVAAVAGEIAGKGAANRQVERIKAQSALRASIEQWAGVRRAAGDDDRVAHRRFYLTTGMTVLDALALPRAEMETMTGMVQSWYM